MSYKNIFTALFEGGKTHTQVHVKPKYRLATFHSREKREMYSFIPKANELQKIQFWL